MPYINVFPPFCLFVQHNNVFKNINVGWPCSGWLCFREKNRCFLRKLVYFLPFLFIQFDCLVIRSEKLTLFSAYFHCTVWWHAFIVLIFFLACTVHVCAFARVCRMRMILSLFKKKSPTEIKNTKKASTKSIRCLFSLSLSHSFLLHYCNRCNGQHSCVH